MLNQARNARLETESSLKAYFTIIRDDWLVVMFGLWVTSMAYPVSSSAKYVLASLAFAAFGGLAFVGSSMAENSGPVVNKPALQITIDKAKVVRIAKSADTVVVGNPGIIDATIQDAKTIVLTGRSFGVTNLIILDSNGDPIVDETVVVQGHTANTVSVYRQALKSTYACNPVCEPMLNVGDEPNAFNSVSEQIEERRELSKADD